MDPICTVTGRSQNGLTYAPLQNLFDLTAGLSKAVRGMQQYGDVNLLTPLLHR